MYYRFHCWLSRRMNPVCADCVSGFGERLMPNERHCMCRRVLAGNLSPAESRMASVAAAVVAATLKIDNRRCVPSLCAVAVCRDEHRRTATAPSK